MNKPSQELKPCPFCGGEARSYSYGTKAAVAHCSNESCAVKPEFHCKEEAQTWDVWNTRADDSHLAAENERLRKLLGEAEDGLEKIENDLIGLGAQDELTYQFPDKAGSLDWLYRYTRETLTKIRAEAGRDV